MAKKIQKKKVKKRSPTQSLRIKEVFEIEKKGKQKIIEKTGKVEEIVSKNNQAEQENKILRNIFIGIGIIILLFLGIWFGQMNKTFEYAGLEWDTIKAGNIKFYHTEFQSSPTNMHQVYLRNDPRKLVEEIKFNGELKVAKMAAMKGIGKFDCDGYGIISQVSLEQTLGAFNVSIIKDENATCDEQNRYTFIEFFEGDETRIDQVMDDSCYKIAVKDCDIMRAKERFIVEIIIASNF